MKADVFPHNRIVIYLCPEGDHQALVSVPSTRKPWLRVACNLHGVWMHLPVTD